MVQGMGVEMKTRDVVIALIAVVAIFATCTVAVEFANARETTEWIQSGNSASRYFSEVSVFCVTVRNSVSCVYVPRDTVHAHTQGLHVRAQGHSEI